MPLGVSPGEHQVIDKDKVMRLLLQQAKPLMEMPCLADPTCVLIDTTRSVSYHHSTNMRHLAASPSACLLLPRMTCPTDLALRPLPARGGSQAIQRDDDAAGAHEHAVTHLWRLFDAEGLRGEDPFLGIQYNLPITASVHAACLTGRAPPSVSYSLPRPHQIAFSTAYLFGGSRPEFLEVAHIDFKLPVDVGDLVRFDSVVLYTKHDAGTPEVHVEVSLELARR